MRHPGRVRFGAMLLASGLCLAPPPARAEKLVNARGTPVGQASPVRRLVRFDLRTGVAPTYAGVSEEEIRKRGFNFLINSLSRHPKRVKLSDGEVQKGIVSQEDFASTDGKERVPLARLLDLDLLNAENGVSVLYPYACQGNDVEEYRLDWLSSAVSNPGVYHLLKQIPTEFKDLADRLGVSPRVAVSGAVEQEKSNLAVQSRIAVNGNPRVLHVEPMTKVPGHPPFFRTTDFAGNAASGREREFSNLGKHPLRHEGKAMELIWAGENGFPVYALYDKLGKRIDEAPASVVENVEGIAPDTASSHSTTTAIKNHFDCMRCHAGGYLGQRSPALDMTKLMEPYVVAGTLTQAEASFAAKLYMEKSDYKKATGPANRDLRATLADAEALVESPDGRPAPVVADFAAEYEKPPTLAQAAREHHTTVDRLVRVLLADDRLRALLGSPDLKKLKPSDELSTRHAFEDSFCLVKLALDKAFATPPGSGERLVPAHGNGTLDAPEYRRPYDRRFEVVPALPRDLPPG